MKVTKRPIYAFTKWLRRQPPKMKLFLAILSGLIALLFLRMVVHDHDSLFVAAELVHALGICLLIYKLAQKKTCARLSLKSQELTAIFLAVRLYCSFVMEYNIHPSYLFLLPTKLHTAFLSSCSNRTASLNHHIHQTTQNNTQQKPTTQ